MNHRAFTLIELLVVVAIIGILAAVGVVAYSGYTSGAKTSSAKANHKSVVKYIRIEVTRCELGEPSVMGGKLNCSSLTGVNIAKAAVMLWWISKTRITQIKKRLLIIRLELDQIQMLD